MEMKPVFRKIEEYLRPIYKADALRIEKEVVAYAKTIKRVKPSADNPYWYKFIDLYFIYPDGVVYNRNQPPLCNLLPHIAHIKTLGCNALHILPFLESPMIDRGFDISNYM